MFARNARDYGKYLGISGERGISLLETIIAVFVLVIMMLGATRAMIILTDQSNLSLVKDEAGSIADQLIIDVQNTPFANLAIGTTNSVETREIGNATINFNIQQTVVNDVPNVARSVAITVTWPFLGRNYVITRTVVVGRKA